MAAGVAEDGDHQVRTAVDHLRDFDEVGTGLDEAAFRQIASDFVRLD